MKPLPHPFFLWKPPGGMKHPVRDTACRTTLPSQIFACFLEGGKHPSIKRTSVGHSWERALTNPLFIHTLWGRRTDRERGAKFKLHQGNSNKNSETRFTEGLNFGTKVGEVTKTQGL